MNADRQRRGRPLSALKGDVPEVHRLVEWLRTLYRDKDLSLRDLEARLGSKYGRTAISERLSGAKPPEWDFVEAVVRACVPPGDRRGIDHLLATGRRLWTTANAAAAREGRVRSGPRTATPIRPSEPPLPQPPAREGVRRRWIAGGAVAGAVVVAAAVVCAILLSPGHRTRRDTPHGTPSPSAGALPPRIRGDASTFVADVTYPDGSWVQVGDRFRKTWEIRNIGRVRWHDRYLVRQGVSPCSSPPRVRVPETAPGADVRISVIFVAPGIPGSCYVEWKMTDDRGRLYFPGLHGVFVDVNVHDTP